MPATTVSPPVLPAGISFKPQHLSDLLKADCGVGFLEIHAENYMGAGGPPQRWLATIMEHWSISLHGVGLSLGSAEGLDADHLGRLARLVDHCHPMLVSEHLAWSVSGGVWLDDLLPLPYTDEALEVVCANVQRTQDVLKRPILVENPSAYLRFAHSPIPEAEFLDALCQRTGCGVLLDVNNVAVTCANLGFDAFKILDRMIGLPVGEIHLAGHAERVVDGVTLRIDDHGSAVCDEVWGLYGRAIEALGPVPTLIEWDTDVPDLAVLVDQARRADRLASRCLMMEARHDVAG